MRKQLLCGVAAATIATFFGGPVSAADLQLVRKAPPLPECDWCGFYVGGHVGYGWSSWDGQLTSDDGPAFGVINHNNFRVNGIVAGFHAGYNWQFGQWVFGIEGDASITPGWNDKLTNPFGPNTVDNSLFAQTQIDWLASIRGRLGMVFNHTLIYGTAGVAWARGTYTAGSSSPQNDDRHRFTKTGFVVGGGIEWKAAPSVSLRLEGLYYIFNASENVLVPNGFGNPPGNLPGDTFKLNNIGVVRVGASWHLPQYY
jgi:outer membrane immunogenic protein